CSSDLIWDIEVEKQFYKNREKHHHQMLHTERDRLEQDWQQRYEAYLKSAEWQQKRQLVLARVQGICEGCRSAVATEVHHLTYADVGSEFLFQLVAMCRPCHDRFHTPPPQPAAAAVPPSKTQESWP
ncbi:MAG: HNH endonuclease, partial [Verrucomicrobiota bacterium]